MTDDRTGVSERGDAVTGALPEPMPLSRLLAEAEAHGVAIDARPADHADPLIAAVAQSHARVTPGALFVARRGASFDAHDRIADAVAAGAAAVVGERPVAAEVGVPYVRVSDARAALPFLAAAFHRHPSRAMTVVGVTGTDGKTTTSYLLHWLLSERFRAGLISTAGVRLGQTDLPTEGHFTTPEATEVQALLARFRGAESTHVVLESSSHGFSLHRLDAVDYDLGVFTNLTQEHLDHHKTWESYREAKATLFRRAARAVINLDDAEAAYFAEAARDQDHGVRSQRHAGRFGTQAVIGYGHADDALVRILATNVRGATLELTFAIAGERHSTSLPMLGSYNAHNAAAAVASAVELGIDPGAAMQRLRSFPGVPGRMHVVQHEPFLVVVDFAHTAPALDKALREVAHRARRLIVVIGAAGERDPGKRAALGEVAATLADIAVFTEEDSRSESLDAILATMARGAERAGGAAGRDFLLVPDRSEAIRTAVAMAAPGDAVVLAGKGHENTLERANETIAWNEVAEAERALSGR